MRSLRPSQGFFAFATASLAVFSLVYGDLAPGGRHLPEWVPARDVWGHGIALLLFAASVGLCFSRTAMASVIAIGAYYAAWALLSVPQILQNPLSIGAWYGLCEATTCLAGAVIVCATLRREREREPRAPAYLERTVWAAEVAFALTCVFYGASHFAYARYTAGMVPTWLPASLALAYLTGIAHMAAGIAIATGVLPRLAARLEALMMILFGLLVWVPTLWADPRPVWATPPENQWSELIANAILAGAACVVAGSLAHRPLGQGRLARFRRAAGRWCLRSWP